MSSIKKKKALFPGFFFRGDILIPFAWVRGDVLRPIAWARGDTLRPFAWVQAIYNNSAGLRPPRVRGLRPRIFFITRGGGREVFWEGMR